MALFGFTNEELLHMTIDRLHPSEDQDEIYGAIRKISSGMSIVGNEIVCLRKDGTLFYCDIFSNAINIGGRELVAGFLIDVTQRRNDRKALLDSNNQLQKINAELDNFVYSVSHDLRSPLLAIQGLLNLIFSAAGEVNKDTQTYLSMIGSSVNRMDDTIKEILEYSRNSRLDVSVKAIDISQLIHEIFEDVKHIYPDSIKMEFSMEGEGLFYSDPYRINTLFKNIISNAVKYQRHGAEPSYLKVQAKMHAGQLLMRFEDNGEGIGETHIDKIFDMFYRASNTSVGTGLGLYICREIVNNLGGSISVVSTPGVGAVFTVTLKNLSPQP
jgi:PAS domain S-box-containing protein